MNVPADLPAVIPWWTLNGCLAEAEALRQLDDMHAKGIREFFLYPNFGLEKPDFLTEEWFGFVAFLLRECPKRMMRFWLYDELSWPSGAAGGRLCRDYPEYRMRSIRRTEQLLKPGESWTPDTKLEYIWAGVFTEGRPVPQEIPVGRKYTNRSNGTKRLVLLDKRLVDDLFFCAMGTSGTWNQPGIMDALNPAAVHAWMGYNYEPYRTRFQKDLGTVIRGFFFDEPTMVSPFHTGDIPWTPGLEELFAEQFGYDSRPLYWTLFTPVLVQDQLVRFRHDFWQLVTYRFAESFTGQLSAWCEENGLMLSGHCWPEEPSCQRLMLTATGDSYALQKHLHLPGTDFLYRENCYTETAGMCPTTPGWTRNLIYSAKLPASTARYNGRRHTICESSGISELSNGPVTPAAQKCVYDFLAAMGIGIMNPARPYDMSGFRKYVCALDAAQPYWQHYAYLVGYLERLGQFNARGCLDTRIAVLNPLTTKFTLSDITPDTSIRQEKTPLPPHADCAEPMLATLDALVRGHRDFELIFEEVLQTNAKDFQVIILPQCYVLNNQDWTGLDRFAIQEGKLIIVGEPPTLSLGHDRVSRPAHPLPGIALDHTAPDFAVKLRQLLDDLNAPQYRLEGEKHTEVLTALRRNGDWQALFLANATPGKKTIQLTGAFAERAKCLIDQNGRRHRWQPKTLVRLAETESILLTTEEPPTTAPAYGAARRLLATLPTQGWQIQTNLRNAMRIQLECLMDNEFHPIDDTGRTDFPLDPDQTPMVTLRGTFEIQGTVPTDLRLWLDCESFCGLTVNGMAINKFENEQWIDSQNITISIAGQCVTGVNTIVVTLALSKWLKTRYGIQMHFTELLKGLTPPILMGAFRVTAPYTLAAITDCAVSCGPMEPQGFPQFGDELAVAVDFDCENPPAQVAWLEPAPCLLPLAAELNGVDLGARIWQTGSFAVPPGILRSHDNHLVVRLCGDIWNTLGRRWAGTPVTPTPFLLPKFQLSV